MNPIDKRIQWLLSKESTIIKANFDLQKSNSMNEFIYSCIYFDLRVVVRDRIYENIYEMIKQNLRIYHEFNL